MATWNRTQSLSVVEKLKTGKLTGRQLRAFWERELENCFAKDPAERFGGWVPRPSGMSVRFKADAPKGQRVLDIRVSAGNQSKSIRPIPWQLVVVKGIRRIPCVESGMSNTHGFLTSMLMRPCEDI